MPLRSFHTLHLYWLLLNCAHLFPMGLLKTGSYYRWSYIGIGYRLWFRFVLTCLYGRRSFFSSFSKLQFGKLVISKGSTVGIMYSVSHSKVALFTTFFNSRRLPGQTYVLKIASTSGEKPFMFLLNSSLVSFRKCLAKIIMSYFLSRNGGTSILNSLNR